MQPSRSPFPSLTPARRRWLARAYLVAQAVLFVYRVIQAFLPDHEPAGGHQPHTAQLTSGGPCCILTSMTKPRVIQYDVAPAGLGNKRVSLHADKVHLHQLTPNGWEDRDLDDSALALVLAALMAHEPPKREETVARDGWQCIFNYTGAGAWQVLWFKLNSVGEPVRVQDREVPLAVKCRIIAQFITGE